MKQVVLYTMEGCPHCQEIIHLLNNENISFVERDTDKYEKEYDLFVKITENEYLPAIMLIDKWDDIIKPDLRFLVPDRDFDSLEDAVTKVKDFLTH